MSDDTQMLQVLRSVSDYLYKSGIGDGSTAVQDIVERYERMKAEWIDPQRLVDLAKRYTDQDGAGCVEFKFCDLEQDRVKCWSVYAMGIHWFDGYTLDAALKEAEA